jgi:hypothetical protein
MDFGRLAAAIAKHKQVKKYIAYVRLLPIIIVSFHAFHTFYGSCDMDND